MPVTTRSQSQRPYGLLPPLKNANSGLPRKLSTKKVGDPIKNPVTFKKPRRAKEALSFPRKSQKGPRKHQSFDKSEQSQTATKLPSPDLSDSTITHWACQKCSCPQGAFDYPVDSCIRCGHEMEQHEKVESDWDPRCSYICERKELVASIMRMLEDWRVVVIRSTPQVGKSILLWLLGHHVLHGRRELEPVFINWRTREERKNLPYAKYLAREKLMWQERNAKHRPCNPEAKTLYLIDEAQQSYEDEAFWTKELKNRFTRSQPMFVLVCLYGADVSIERPPYIDSRSLSINPVQRVELRPSQNKNSCILFTLQETTVVVQKWAISNQYELTDGLYEYLHVATGGHPGMVGFVLRHFDYHVWKSTEAARRLLLWTPKRCHDILIDHNDLINELTQWGRGLWTTTAEGFVKRYIQDAHLLNPRFLNIKFSDVVNTLRQVATQPHGYTPENGSVVFEFCHLMGTLYTQQTRPGSDRVTYTFASPIHRRVAYRRLCPGPEPDSKSKNLTLRETCLNAIGRLSPSALQTRSTQSYDCGSIPEAAFQDEMYCALNFELQNLPILSEYSHSKDGRVDFFIYDKKWGIEVLQCGSVSKIAEHAARFVAGGRYQEWNIFKDYIILNFCSKSTVRNIEIEDVEVQSRILQIVVDSNEYIAEVYSYDKQLLAALTLGEGRLRFEPNKEDPPIEDLGLKVAQNRIARMEQEKEGLERQMEQMQDDMKRQIEQEKEGLKRQMEQMQDDMRRQMEQMQESKSRTM